jgi:hypothetical protein
MLFVVLIVLTFVRLLIQGVCLKVLWNMYIPQSLHLQSINFSQAIGFLLIIGLIFVSGNLSKSEDTKEILLREGIYPEFIKIGYSLIVCLLGAFFAS